MNALDQLKTELDRYEAAHGTDCRHPDGRLESRQMIALIGRTLVEALTPRELTLKDVQCGHTQSTTQYPETWVDEKFTLWCRTNTPGFMTSDGDQFLWGPSDMGDSRYRAACAILWPEFVLPPIV